MKPRSSLALNFLLGIVGADLSACRASPPDEVPLHHRMLRYDGVYYSDPVLFDGFPSRRKHAAFRLFPDNTLLFAVPLVTSPPAEIKGDELDWYAQWHDVGQFLETPHGARIEVISAASRIGPHKQKQHSYDLIDGRLIEIGEENRDFGLLNFVARESDGPPQHAGLCPEHTTPFYYPNISTWCVDSNALYHGPDTYWRCERGDLKCGSFPPIDTAMRIGRYGDWSLTHVTLYEHGRMVWNSDDEGCVCWDLSELAECKKTCSGEWRDGALEPADPEIEVRLHLRKLTRQQVPK